MAEDLGQRVSVLETDVRSILDGLKRLGEKLDERSRPQWGVYAAFGMLAIAVLGGFGKLAYDPIRDNTMRLEAAFERVNDKVVPRAEHERAWAQQQRTIDRIVTRLDRVEYGRAQSNLGR